MFRNSWLQAIAGGVAGAATLTALNELARRRIGSAPRLDLLGERALAGGLRFAGLPSPRGASLRRAALAGDLAANSLYYGLLVAGKRRRWLRGLLGGAAAGLGAVLLPPALGLRKKRERDHLATRAMTMAWYLAGGLVASATSRSLTEPHRDDGPLLPQF